MNRTTPATGERIAYEMLEAEAAGLLLASGVLTLATCAGGRTTCRAMSCVTDGLAVLFQTSRRSLKWRQLKRNPRVALGCANLSLEGRARCLGHPLAEPDFRRAYEARHPGPFRTYSFLKDEVVVRVEPTLVTLWKYIDGKPCREFLEPSRRRAVRVSYPADDRVDGGDGPA